MKISLALVGLLAAMFQIAAPQQNDEVPLSCPPVSSKSLKLTCKALNGTSVPCKEAGPGTKLQMAWRKTLHLSENTAAKISGGLQCQDSGEWRLDSTRTGYKQLRYFGYYKYSASEESWYAATIKCLHDGGHLLIIDSQEELTAVQEYLNTVVPHVEDGKFREIYYGMHDIFTESYFETVLGVPINQMPLVLSWGKDEPAKGAKADYEDCLIIRYPQYTLHDVKCEMPFHFVCERSL